MTFYEQELRKIVGEQYNSPVITHMTRILKISITMVITVSSEYFRMTVYF